MLSRENELERIYAVLHNVVGNSDITFDDLRKHRFLEDIIAVLDCQTNRNGESNGDLIDRVFKYETVCRVKLADLNDNMVLIRIKNPNQHGKSNIKMF